jgi:hypothetical protein
VLLLPVLVEHPAVETTCQDNMTDGRNII